MRAKLLCLLLAAAGALWPQSGIFEGHGDVGTVLHPGALQFDGSRGAYRVSGSGENMWAAVDAFHYVWKKVSGDVEITADISILGEGGDAHRKAALMIRQSLDADSAYADAALHGSGLTSLQSRPEKGAVTYEVQSSATAPKKLRLVKRGDNIYMYVGGADGKLHFSGGSVPVKMTGPFYIGLAVCAHNKDRVETAEFTGVEIAAPPVGPLVRYSTVETAPYPSGDRRAVFAAAGLIERPMWPADASSVNFIRDGRLEGVPAAGLPAPGLKPQPMSAGAMRLSPAPWFVGRMSPDRQWLYFTSDRSGSMQVWRRHSDGGGDEQVTKDAELANWYPHLSPDGTKLLVLSCPSELPAPPARPEAQLRAINLADGAARVLARFLTGVANDAAWSADGKRVAFITEQWLPPE